MTMKEKTMGELSISQCTGGVALIFALSACTGGRPLDHTAAPTNSNDAPVTLACDPEPYNPLRNAYFGDLHQHTAYSLDAFAAKNLPEQAYRFARGEATEVPPYDADGRSLLPLLTIDRPLDFAAATDHSEWLGERQLCTDPDLDPVAYNSAECSLYREDINTGFLAFGGAWGALLSGVGPLPVISDDELRDVQVRPPFCGPLGEKCIAAGLTPWQDTVRQAERFNQPGCFTAFNGYEYTLTPLGDNMHRNVIFRNEHVPEYPVTSYEAETPTLLWERLDEKCLAPCEYITIPHGANLSNGRMFAGPEQGGYSVDDKRRTEPLIEVFQVEGDSECSNVAGASEDDPLCGFEKWPFINFAEYFVGVNPSPGVEAKQNFVRYGLSQGMLYEQEYGANPFQYGFIASTDGHYGLLGAVDEVAFPGSQIVPPVAGVSEEVWNNPGGLAVAWAEENTRDSLFDAFLRKETYATSGPRIHLRVFAGDAENLPQDLCAQGNDTFVRSGYANGVPMGGELTTAAGGMRLAVWAAADPLARENARSRAVPLQKLQIIKGWIETDGTGNQITAEKVFDVSVADNPSWSVDETSCQVRGGDSAGQLCVVWDDPEFHSSQGAFYYTRVVEQPTCRWLTRQCLNAPKYLDCSDPDPDWAACCEVESGNYPTLIQERAWSSPVWYKP